MVSNEEFKNRRKALLEAMAKGLGIPVGYLPKIIIDFSNPDIDLFLKRLDESEELATKVDFMCNELVLSM